MKTQFHQFFDACPDAMLVVDPSGAISEANPSAEALFGYRHGQLRGRHTEVLFPGQSFAQKSPRHGQGTQAAQQMELVGTRSDHTQFPAQIDIITIQAAHKTVTVMSVTDITRQQRAEFVLGLGLDAVGSSDRDREDLLGALIRAQEEERSRIAAGIHDDTIQMLTAANLALQQLRLRLRDPEHVQILDRLAGTLSMSMERLRQLIFDLRPTGIGNGSITAALRAYLEEMRSESGITYRYDDSRTARAPASTNMLIYRVVREALVNVRKHARARTVRVQLRDVSDGYLVGVVDDGVGYSPAEVEDRPGHLGLVLMRERVQAAGGWCRIESTPGGGTTVEFWVPLQAPPHQPELGRDLAA
jgi:PAS domain S-box-containing protein